MYCSAQKNGNENCRFSCRVIFVVNAAFSVYEGR